MKSDASAAAKVFARPRGACRRTPSLAFGPLPPTNLSKEFSPPEFKPSSQTYPRTANAPRPHLHARGVRPFRLRRGRLRVLQTRLAIRARARVRKGERRGPCLREVSCGRAEVPKPSDARL